MPVACERRRCWRMSGTGSSAIWPFKPPGTTNSSNRLGRVAAISCWTVEFTGRSPDLSKKRALPPLRARAPRGRRPDRRRGSVLLPQADAGVIVPQDAVKGGPGLRHSEASHLAQPDAVAPALAGEDEPRDVAARVALAIDHEQVLAQAQAPADAQAFQHHLAVAAQHRRLDHAAGDAEPPGHDVAHASHAPEPRESVGHLVGSHADFPAIELR